MALVQWFSGFVLSLVRGNSVVIVLHIIFNEDVNLLDSFRRRFHDDWDLK